MTVRVKLLAGTDGGVDRNSGKSSLSFLAWDTDKTRYDTDNISNIGTLIVDLYDAVKTASPLTWQGLTRQRIEWTEYGDRTRTFQFTVHYSWALPESEIRWSFDTGGGNFKITASKATTRYARTGGIAPDFQGAIEVKDGRAEGVEITIPALKLTATYRHAPSSAVVNAGNIDTYINTLSSMTGTTNNATWLTRQRGELLFLGASGEYVPNQPFEVQYHFAYSKNAGSLTIGEITGIVKRGHDYVWVLYEPSEDSASHKMVTSPLAAYVERVYDESNFTALGIS